MNMPQPNHISSGLGIPTWTQIKSRSKPNPQKRLSFRLSENENFGLECLEYILVHEMLHLLVRRHNEQFHALMDAHLPGWRQTRQTLNAAPLAHVEWEY